MEQESLFNEEKIVKEPPSKENYSAESIQALEGIEHVRKRPSMYIGDLGPRGLHHLVYEVIDNSIDEAMGGYCDKIDLTINEDNSITVVDNGRGIPVGIHKKEGVSALEVVMTKIGAGGKFDKDSYKVSGGLHGVGVSCVNALSEKLTAIVYRDGKIWEQKYERGKAMDSVKEIGDSKSNGTSVTFLPDRDIFIETIDFNYETLSLRMRELSYLNKGIKISISDKRRKDNNGNYVVNLPASITKNGEPRGVPLTERAKSIVVKLLDKAERNDLVFKHLKYWTCENTWRRLRKAMNLEEDKEFVIHCLRHTCATRLAQSGKVELHMIGQMLGHKSWKMIKRYSHLIPNNLRGAINVLNEVNTLNNSLSSSE